MPDSCCAKPNLDRGIGAFVRKSGRLPDLKDLGKRINVENLDNRFGRTSADDKPTVLVHLSRFSGMVADGSWLSFSS